MGIVNVTPDSFSDGGRHFDRDAAVRHARQLVDEGADVLDIGGESTRPGAEEIPVDEEIRRTAPVIAELRQGGMTQPISVDTRKAAVARAALEAGADWVNDVSGLTWDAEMAAVVADAGCPVILMHMRGTPADMTTRTRYDDVVEDVLIELAQRRDAALASGIAGDRIMLDPGIGFAKTPEQNLVLLRHLARLHDLGHPVVLGASRKRVIGHVLDTPADERVEGTVAVTVLAVAAGIDTIRVHDVRANRRAADMAAAIVNAGSNATPATDIAE
jgi:dihydropteroate synthase